MVGTTFQMKFSWICSTCFVFQNEDEWKEFQEDKKDYSGLKLQPLKVTDINTLDNDKGQNELNEDGTEMSENGKKKPGPWKISDNQNETSKYIKGQVFKLMLVAFWIFLIHLHRSLKCILTWACCRLGGEVRAWIREKSVLDFFFF